MEITEKIRVWYLGNRRSLPWRETRDPYRIWVSEIILQQTRVMQGLEFYRRFLVRFPNLESLTGATEDEVLRIWQGLGYYSRARNMLEAARYILNEKGGKFPASYAGLLELKGVGTYTAAAVASIAFNEPRAVVDGNVHRVLSRLYGIEEKRYGPTTMIAGKAESLLDVEDPGLHNQAIMELGALVCTPGLPDCPSCPLQDECVAHLLDRTAELPPRNPQGRRKKRYFHYLVLYDEKGIWLGPRQKKDIWQGLYEFPLIETTKKVSPATLVKSEAWESMLGPHSSPAEVIGPIKHTLSHQEIQAVFYRVRTSDPVRLQGYEKVSRQELDRYPVPKLIGRYLDKLSD